MKLNRIIIAGSRSVPERDIELTNKILSLMQSLVLEETEIVSGTAKGADKLGEHIAQVFGYSLKQFPADWSQGKRAGYFRNKQMAEYATHLIAIWDGESKGTMHMIDLAHEHGLNVRVIRYK